MEITQKEEKGIVCITIKGRLDGESSPAAGKVTRSILEAEKRLLLFDLSELEYLSSAGLRVILEAAKEVKLNEGKLVLCGLNKFVKEIFVTSGFDAVIPIADTIETGMALF
ncbi:MAG TPA: STAS domain-containing protein [Deltaproteobacteria bacterium]|nr:STAS domain-containing protein [Deltaproteobacteria bacterium]